MVEALTEDACRGRQLLRVTDRNQDAGGVI
jgi:hypothetical protein